MGYNTVSSLLLSFIIFLVVILLCYKDKKKADEISGKENEEESQEELANEISEELDPRSSFDYIIGCYFESEYKGNFFNIYKKLLDKVSDISMDPRCNSDDFEKYSDLTSEFFSFCIKCESYDYALFDYKNYGVINISRLQTIEKLDENRVRQEVKKAKRALNSNDANRIFNHFDLETVLSAVVYYSLVHLEEKKYMEVRELSKRLCKQEKVDFHICDLYMKHKKGNSVQVKESVEKLPEETIFLSNGITIEKTFCIESALNWMGEKECEELLLSSRYKKKTIY